MNDLSASEVLEQVFQVSHPARLYLSNIRGSVQVRPGENGVIQVRAVKYTENGNAAHTQVMLSQDEDGSVRAETRFAEAGILGQRRPCRVDYTVQVPPACSLHISGVSNSASIEGVQGDLTLSTISGDVQLGELSGALKISSVSGDGQASRLSGSLELDTVSGDVSFRDSQFESLQASTVSGDLQFHTALQAGPYKIKSVSGDVSLHLPAEAACTIQSDSLSGDVHCNLPVTSRKHSAHHKRLEVQGGGVIVTHSSVSGDLHVFAPQPASGNAGANEAASADHMPVLERVERGELSVQEALELLNKGEG